MKSSILERDAQKIANLVRERGPQTAEAIARLGIDSARQTACAPRVNQILEEAGIAA